MWKTFHRNTENVRRIPRAVLNDEEVRELSFIISIAQDFSIFDLLKIKRYIGSKRKIE